jgi:hypothetical protein
LLGRSETHLRKSSKNFVFINYLDRPEILSFIGFQHFDDITESFPFAGMKNSREKPNLLHLSSFWFTQGKVGFGENSTSIKPFHKRCLKGHHSSEREFHNERSVLRFANFQLLPWRLLRTDFC